MQAPQMIEELNFEQILQARKARFLELCTPSERLIWEKRLSLESEPVVKLLEESVYREMVLRNRINQAVKACFLLTAQGSDLDNLAEFYGEKRLILRPANPEKKQAEIKENDEAFLRRIQLSLHKLAGTGTASGYKAHSLGFSAEIKDVYVNRPSGGNVDVFIFADDEKLEELKTGLGEYLSSPEIKILCDKVTVKAYEKLTYDLNIQITLQDSLSLPNSTEFFQTKIKEFLSQHQGFSSFMPNSQIVAFVFSLGNVKDVKITTVEPTPNAPQVAICNNLTVELS